MKQKLYALLQKRQGLVAAMEAAVGTDGFKEAQAAVTAANTEIEQLQAVIAETEKHGTPEPQGGIGVQATVSHSHPSGEGRGSREYARAFCTAIRARAQGNETAYAEARQVMQAALTESGGASGENGGFLVPVDMQTAINEQRRTLNPLSELFSTESVTAPTGYRVMDKHPTTGFTKTDEMKTIPLDDQPSFVRISYKVQDYALIVPTSNDLLHDETAGLMGYLARWFAKKGINTENKLLINMLRSLTATAIAAGEEMSGIKAMLNKKLDPAISLTSVILTNQDGFDKLDQLTDSNGRPLLQPDPTNATQYRFAGRNVHVASNATLAGSAGTAPIAIGDLKQFATLFRREPLQVESTSVGGNAWRTNSTEIRGIMRLDAKTFDTEAAVLGSLTL